MEGRDLHAAGNVSNEAAFFLKNYKRFGLKALISHVLQRLQIS